MWCVSFSSSHKKTSKLSNIILHQFEGLHKLWDTPQLCNIAGTGSWNNPQIGRVYSVDGCSPTLNCCGGGGHEPKIVINPLKDKTEYSWHFEQNVYDASGISRAVKAGGGSGNIPKVIIDDTNSGLHPEPKVCTNTLPTLRASRFGLKCAIRQATETGICEESSIRIRKLTPKECWRLMGFFDDDFAKAEKAVSNSQLYKQAGNSIVVDVLYYIFVELYKAMPYMFDNLKLSSFFSGIGAFEVALNRLYYGINEGNFIKGEE